jgi:hypothetical protein
MPAPLARIVHTLHSLPAVHDVIEVQLQLGLLVCLCPVDWKRDTYNMVLGHNNCGDMVELLRCLTAGGLATTKQLPRRFQAVDLGEGGGPTEPRLHPPFSHRLGLAHLLHFLHRPQQITIGKKPWSVVPRRLAVQHGLGWIQFVPTALLALGWSAPRPTSPTRPIVVAHHDTMHTLIERLGWKVPNEDGGSEPAAAVPSASLSVRMAYRMLMQLVVEMRVAERWRTFIADA